MREQGEAISKIVADKGWPAFREMERAVIARLSRLERRVVATGGGVVVSDENIANMKKSGHVFWLRATPETIQKRMAADDSTDASRPALTDKGVFEEIEEVLATRHPLYERAMNHAIDTDDMSPEAVCSAILKQLESK